MYLKYRILFSFSGKFPIASFTIIGDPETCMMLKSIEQYLLDELNVEKIDYGQNEQFFVDYEVSLNIPEVKKRVDGKSIPVLRKYVESLTVQQKEKICKTKSTDNDCPVMFSELIVKKLPKIINSSNVVLCSDKITVCFDSSITEFLREKFFVRQLNREYQKARKTAGLVPTDDVQVLYSCSPQIHNVLQRHNFLGSFIHHLENCDNSDLYYGSHDLELGTVTLKLTKKE